MGERRAFKFSLRSLLSCRTGFESSSTMANWGFLPIIFFPDPLADVSSLRGKGRSSGKDLEDAQIQIVGGRTLRITVCSR